MMTSQLPECGKLLYSIVFFFCEESLVCDTNLHYKDCSELHSGSCSQMTSSWKCPIGFTIHSTGKRLKVSINVPTIDLDYYIIWMAHLY